LFYVKRLNQACSPALPVVDKANIKLQTGVPLFDYNIKRVDTYSELNSILQIVSKRLVFHYLPTTYPCDL